MRLPVAREQVLTTCLALANRGYLAATGGNVALRIDETQFVVTPFACALTQSREQDVTDVIADAAVAVEARDGDAAAGIETVPLRRVQVQVPLIGREVGQFKRPQPLLQTPAHLAAHPAEPGTTPLTYRPCFSP